MSSVEAKLVGWFLITADLLQRPVVELPLDELRDQMLSSFDADIFTFNTRTGYGERTAQGFGWNTPGSLDIASGLPVFLRQADASILDFHPLIQWYARTGQSAPLSLARVPRSFGRSWQARELGHLIHTFGIDRQLSIPLSVNGLAHEALVLGRGAGADFSESDMQLAIWLQPMLTALHRQARFLGSAPIPPEAIGRLTGRELAVLRCVAQGLTAQSIGYELSISPRTAEKHLESVYRKLGVRDKVSAVMVAVELGLVEQGRRATRTPHALDA